MFLRFELSPHVIFQCYKHYPWQLYLFFPSLIFLDTQSTVYQIKKKILKLDVIKIILRSKLTPAKFQLLQILDMAIYYLRQVINEQVEQGLQKFLRKLAITFQRPPALYNKDCNDNSNDKECRHTHNYPQVQIFQTLNIFRPGS